MTGHALRPELFTAEDMADIRAAGTVFAAALADISHHEIGEAGWWDCYGTGPDEIARLRDALDRMCAAVGQARSQLATVERRAWLAAGRRAAGWSS